MEAAMNNSLKRLQPSRWLLIGLAMLTVLTGCMQQANYGGFSRDDQVSHAFQSGAVPAELKYYYTGRDTMPYAIMGIDPEYTVPSKYWIAFKPEPEKLKNMSSNIYGHNRDNPYGFNILAPDGTPVGIWFSNLRFSNVRIDQENRTLEVLYKNPENRRDF
jgi:hypothetical protein